MPPLLLVHITAGALAILSGTAAASVRKGGRLHRAFGAVFCVCMLIMSALGAYLAVFGPQPSAGAAPPRASVAVGVLTFYLVATAWTTVRRKDKGVGLFEYGAFLVAFGAAAALLAFAVQVLKTPDAIPYFAFAFFAAFAAALDFKVIMQGGVSGAQRIARHLWRMCFALFFAASFFFLGQQKVMPAILHGSPILFAPAFAPLALMIFWLLRVRLTGWIRRDAVTT